MQVLINISLQQLRICAFL